MLLDLAMEGNRGEKSAWYAFCVQERPLSKHSKSNWPSQRIQQIKKVTSKINLRWKLLNNFQWKIDNQDKSTVMPLHIFRNMVLLIMLHEISEVIDQVEEMLKKITQPYCLTKPIRFNKQFSQQFQNNLKYVRIATTRYWDKVEAKFWVDSEIRVQLNWTQGSYHYLFYIKKENWNIQFMAQCNSDFYPKSVFKTTYNYKMKEK